MAKCEVVRGKKPKLEPRTLSPMTVHPEDAEVVADLLFRRAPCRSVGRAAFEAQNFLGEVERAERAEVPIEKVVLELSLEQALAIHKLTGLMTPSVKEALGIETVGIYTALAESLSQAGIHATSTLRGRLKYEGPLRELLLGANGRASSADPALETVK